MRNFSSLYVSDFKFFLLHFTCHNLDFFKRRHVRKWAEIVDTVQLIH